MKLTPDKLREQFAKNPDLARRNPGVFDDRRPSKDPELKRAPQHGPLPAVPAPQGVRPRFSVRIISFRARLLDPDNLVGKYAVDCLRYAGLLPDDTAEIMDYRIEQQKCPKAEERTEIEVVKL